MVRVARFGRGESGEARRNDVGWGGGEGEGIPSEVGLGVRSTSLKGGWREEHAFAALRRIRKKGRPGYVICAGRTGGYAVGHKIVKVRLSEQARRGEGAAPLS